MGGRAGQERPPRTRGGTAPAWSPARTRVGAWGEPTPRGRTGQKQRPLGLGVFSLFFLKRDSRFRLPRPSGTCRAFLIQVLPAGTVPAQRQGPRRSPRPARGRAAVKPPRRRGHPRTKPPGSPALRGGPSGATCCRQPGPAQAGERVRTRIKVQWCDRRRAGVNVKPGGERLGCSRV